MNAILTKPFSMEKFLQMASLNNGPRYFLASEPVYTR